MPQTILNQWKREKEAWMRLNPEPHTERQRHELQTVFSEKQQAWLDAGHGSCVLRHQQAAKVVADALEFFDIRRYELGDYVVMPNHVHVLVTPLRDHELSSILHSWKSYTSKELNKLLGKTGTLWQDESCDHIVRGEAELTYYRQYIEDNPRRARLKVREYILRRER